MAHRQQPPAIRHVRIVIVAPTVPKPNGGGHDGQVWDADQGKCVPETSTTVCTRGYYPTPSGCAQCPEPSNFTPSNSRCATSSTSTADASDRRAIETCYMPQQYLSLDNGVVQTPCEYGDDSGQFEFTQNCHYSASATAN